MYLRLVSTSSIQIKYKCAMYIVQQKSNEQTKKKKKSVRTMQKSPLPIANINKFRSNMNVIKAHSIPNSAQKSELLKIHECNITIFNCYK